LKKYKFAIFKYITASIITASIPASLGFAISSYRENVETKLKVEIYIESVREMKEDIKEIRKDIKEILKTI